MLRRLRQTVLTSRYAVQAHWLTLPDHHTKRHRIIRTVQETGYREFIETGTYLGATAMAVAPHVDRCTTIELDQTLYDQALKNLVPFENVVVLQGPSETLVPSVLSGLRQPAVFWLDAHYSRGRTTRSALDTPIVRELLAVFDHPIHEHVIMVDDARNFVGTKGYPTIRTLDRLVRRHGRRLRIWEDIITIRPKDYREA